IQFNLSRVGTALSARIAANGDSRRVRHARREEIPDPDGNVFQARTGKSFHIVQQAMIEGVEAERRPRSTNADDLVRLQRQAPARMREAVVDRIHEPRCRHQSACIFADFTILPSRSRSALRKAEYAVSEYGAGSMPWGTSLSANS